MDRELEMRFEYFWHAISGQKTDSMLSIERRFPDMEFKRLGDLRWSLTHWTLLQYGEWWLMLFPYGGSHWYVSRKLIDIVCPLFAFAWRKKKKEVTWNDKCHCGKLFKEHNEKDLHDCELTGDENQRGLEKV